MEFRIENEVMQLNAAVERFNTEYGFYPPAIGPNLEIDSVEKFSQYLGRIAPNHDEGTGVDGGGLDKWWTHVGRHLDERSSLVFWLSGLCSSKRYPLSGNARLTTPLAPYDANKCFDDSEFTDETGAPTDVNINRHVFFEFRQRQLASCSGRIPLGIKGYNQPYSKGDLRMFEYRDFMSYEEATLNSVLKTAYHSDVDDNGNPINFFNPTSFQIVGPGMDGKMSDEAIANTNLADSAFDSAQDDNITNFSSGRLEKLRIE